MTPALSIVFATHNRRDVAVATVERLRECGLSPSEIEILVVDNASTDGAPDALAAIPDVQVLRLRRNLGACAKALAVPRARADVILLVDDDSHPRPGCAAKMLELFERQPRLGAAGFTVHLPDGSEECSALPHVFVGCGVGLRTRALRAVGGLDLSLFMAAEEYDVAFRLLQAGWHVENFAQLQVEHLKSPTARRSERVTYFDIRNNLRLIGRYLSGEHARAYRRDWTQRYAWLAQAAGHERAFRLGRRVGAWRALMERPAYRRRRLSPAACEAFFSWNTVEQRMNALYQAGVRRLLLADAGKNMYAFWRGARRSKLGIVAIVDDRVAAPGRLYRGIPIVSMAQARDLRFDAVVVSNTSYVHARLTVQRVACLGPPVHNWFPRPAHSDPESDFTESGARPSHHSHPRATIAQRAAR